MAESQPQSKTDESVVSDTELVALAREGDLSAYDVLVSRYQESITGLLFRFCPHRSDLEDLVQEALIKAFRNLDKWRETASFGSWLKKIAVNTGYDYYRKSNRQATSLVLGSAEANEIALEQLEEKQETKTRSPYMEEVHRVIGSLKPDEKLVITLQYLEQMPLQEIAEKLDWGLSKTKVKSFRAKKKLKDKLKRYGITKFQ